MKPLRLYECIDDDRYFFAIDALERYRYELVKSVMAGIMIDEFAETIKSDLPVAIKRYEAATQMIKMLRTDKMLKESELKVSETETPQTPEQNE